MLPVLVLLASAPLSGCGRIHKVEQQLADLKGQVATLKLQAQASRDWIAIANLQATYGYYVDRMRWDDAADLFSKSATLEIAGREPIEGQEGVRKYLRTMGRQDRGAVLHHVQLQPVIHVGADGLSAKGRWLSAAQAAAGRDAHGDDAIYENEYVKEDGIWRISKVAQVPASQDESGKERNNGVAAPVMK